MKIPLQLGTICFLALTHSFGQESLPADEAGIIAHFEKAGARVTKNDDGHAVKLFSGGNPAHSVAELQLIGKLAHLEHLALNNPQAGAGEWGFLLDLPSLKNLTIWHCKTIDSLAPFSGLPIESITVGGSMGLRDLNREHPEKHRDAVLSLTELPNLKSVNLYHSPLLPGDEHLEHLVKNFPKLEEVKIDLNAPRGFETTVTPDGLRALSRLPLKLLSLENIHALTPDHMEAIAEIETLEAFFIDCRKNPFDTATLENTLYEKRKDLEIVVAGPDAKGPPKRSRK